MRAALISRPYETRLALFSNEADRARAMLIFGRHFEVKPIAMDEATDDASFYYRYSDMRNGTDGLSILARWSNESIRKGN